MQSAMVCPLLTVVVLYGERVSFSASVGVALLFCGLFFWLGPENRTGFLRSILLKFIGWTSLSFALTGLMQTLSMLPGKMPEFSTAAAPDPNAAMIPALLSAAGEWAQQIASDTATYATKRNLVMSMVKSLTCIKRTPTEMTLDLELVMPSSNKWWAIRVFRYR